MSRRDRNRIISKVAANTDSKKTDKASQIEETLKKLDSLHETKKQDLKAIGSTPKNYKPYAFGIIIIVLFALVFAFSPTATNNNTNQANTGLSITDDLNFKIQKIDGSEVYLSDFIGKKIVLDLFATWCVPCKQQISVLKTFKSGHPEVQIISVSIEPTDTVEVLSTYSTENEMTWVVGRDVDQVAGSLFSATAIPTLVYIDSTGIFKRSHQGVLTYEELEDFISDS